MSQRFKHLQSNGACSLITAVTVLVCGCTQAPSLLSNGTSADSLVLHISSPLPWKHLDLFIYADTLTRALESHTRLGSAGSIRIPAGKSYRLAFALANSRREFKSFPASFGVVEKLTMDYKDEDPSAPMLAGYCHLQDGRTAELEILPLLCPVHVGSISLKADAPLKDPVLRLVRVNARAEVLRKDGFHPSSTLDSPAGLDYPLMMLQELPFDIGSQPQEADLTLWCYPNEDEDGPGGGGTSLIVSGLLGGERREYRIPLGPVGRGAAINLNIELKE